ncbi:hypothetical protein GJV85_13355 (plasmid) [Sulfurimonas aquatica]|uniref:Uncharacterized protein n=1 Tax=Sulfurimonas aquatica TaxID=2672570 RepID=A0A975B2Q6_9BACT|nr:hypothetical protein [Sulfurimonas aquatica]QSZ43157.1 hypothetical protein GJV85_13355 [Sulfurimonas aquatica]
MRYLLFLLAIKALELHAQTYVMSAQAKSIEAATDKASKKAVVAMHEEILNKIGGSCKDYPVEINSEEYQADFIMYKERVITPKGYRVQAEFDLFPKDEEHTKKVLQRCDEKREEYWQGVKTDEFMQKFSLGVGVMGWTSTLGAEFYLEYLHKDDVSITLTGSVQDPYIKEDSGPSAVDLQSIATLGFEVRYLYFTAGFEKVLSYSAPTAIPESDAPSSSLLYGVSYRFDDCKKLCLSEVGFVFKYYNDKESGAGGLRVRYNLY